MLALVAPFVAGCLAVGSPPDEAPVAVTVDLQLPISLERDSETGGGAPPTRTIQLVPQADGALFLWVDSEQFDPRLRVRLPDASTRTNDNGGGGTRPFLEVAATAGAAIGVTIEAARGAGGGSATLVVRVARDTDAGLAVIAESRDGLDVDPDVTIARLLAVEGADRSGAVAAWLRNEVNRRIGIGDCDGAVEPARFVLRFDRSMYPADHHRSQSDLNLLALALDGSDRAPEARPLYAELVQSLERCGPSRAVNLRIARANLANASIRCGEPESAADLYRGLLAEAQARTPVDAEAVVTATQGLAEALLESSRTDEAIALVEPLVARLASAPVADADRINAELTLARAWSDRGDVERALPLFQRLLGVSETLLDPRDHGGRVIRVHAQLALEAAGDLAGARRVAESALERCERILPPGHPQILFARLDLADSRIRLGDLAGASEVLEALEPEASRTRPPGDALLRSVRRSLASTRFRLGRGAEAAGLLDLVLLDMERYPTRPRELDETLMLRAVIAADASELDLAERLERRVLERREATLAADHPSLADARIRLALTSILAGNLLEAVKLLELALAAPRPERRRNSDLAARALAEAHGRLGHTDAQARALLDAARVRAWVRTVQAGASSERDAARFLDLDEVVFGPLLSFAARAPHHPETPAVVEQAFVLVERARRAVFLPRELDRLERSPSAGAAHRLRAARRRTAQLAECGDVGSRFTAAVEDAERAERELRAAAGGSPLVADPSSAAVAARLAPHAAAVAFVEYARSPLAGEPGTPWIAAFVVRAGRALAWVDLAPSAEVEQAVERWTTIVAAAPDLTRGLREPVLQDSAGEERAAGAAVSQLVLEPLREALDGADRIEVVPSAALALVPFGALPCGDGRWCDRVAVHVAVSLAPRAPDAGPPASLVVASDVDYGAPQPGRAVFAPLPETAPEGEAIRAEFASAFGPDARSVHLTGRDATRDAISHSVERAGFVHVATHGWVDLGGDAPGAARLQAFAPYSRCGLACAGANSGRGVLTAEELSGLDLAATRIVVLSACRTAAGEPRGSAALASLRAALHAAGARTVISSTWRVGDRATRDLMVEFDRRLWSERRPALEALREAQASLRARGAPLRDWAAWVLSGDPD